MWPFKSRKQADQRPLTADADRLLNQRIVQLRGPLNDDQAAQVIAQLLFLQHENSREPITLLIDSPGGSITAGMAIIDTMKVLAPAVRTQCDCDAHGMAAAILACGQRGQRVVGRGSAISLTPISAIQSGVPDSDLEKTRQLLAGVIAAASGCTAETVGADMVAERFFDPVGAVKYGLADRVAG